MRYTLPPPSPTGYIYAVEWTAHLVLASYTTRYTQTIHMTDLTDTGVRGVPAPAARWVHEAAPCRSRAAPRHAVPFRRSGRVSQPPRLVGTAGPARAGLWVLRGHQGKPTGHEVARGAPGREGALEAPGPRGYAYRATRATRATRVTRATRATRTWAADCSGRRVACPI